MASLIPTMRSEFQNLLFPLSLILPVLCHYVSPLSLFRSLLSLSVLSHLFFPFLLVPFPFLVRCFCPLPLFFALSPNVLSPNFFSLTLPVWFSLALFVFSHIFCLLSFCLFLSLSVLSHCFSSLTLSVSSLTHLSPLTPTVFFPLPFSSFSYVFVSSFCHSLSLVCALTHFRPLPFFLFLLAFLSFLSLCSFEFFLSSPVHFALSHSFESVFFVLSSINSY